MQREYAIRQDAKREGYRTEKLEGESYRLINARMNVAVYKVDGVSLEAVASFLDQRESRANAAGHA
jgi:23S rRNA G2069 N7-methylase RlmK/C1962 C5-methylase RlmI